MPQHRDPATRAGCAARTAGMVAAVAVAVAGVTVAVALSTGPAEAAPAEEPRRAGVCIYNGSGGLDCLKAGPWAPTWTPPEVPGG